MNSPLDQFDVFLVKGLYLLNYNLDISIFNTILPMLYIIVLFSIAFVFFSKHSKIVPKGMQILFEKYIVSVWGLLQAQTTKNIKYNIQMYFPFILTLFTFILFTNLFSLMPFGIALTSFININIMISFVLIIGITLIGIDLYLLNFVKMFVPNSPLWLLFLLVPIEIFSYLVRCFSLSIRLSANILAGHTLVYIIVSFISIIMKLSYIFFFISMLFLSSIFLLELGVAFLQAYVFVTLFLIYLNEMFVGPSH